MNLGERNWRKRFNMPPFVVLVCRGSDPAAYASRLTDLIYYLGPDRLRVMAHGSYSPPGTRPLTRHGSRILFTTWDPTAYASRLTDLIYYLGPGRLRVTAHGSYSPPGTRLFTRHGSRILFTTWDPAAYASGLTDPTSCAGHGESSRV